jgi:two-component system chemotaxis response regulator CheY
MACNILIVDDSKMTRAMVRRIISMCGTEVGEVFEAEDGVAGLFTLAREQIGLVLVDLHMPRMGGLEMTSRMAADPAMKQIPVVIISADPNANRIDRGANPQVRGQLTKPFTPESFRDLFLEILGVPANA